MLFPVQTVLQPTTSSYTVSDFTSVVRIPTDGHPTLFCYTLREVFAAALPAWICMYVHDGERRFSLPTLRFSPSHCLVEEQGAQREEPY